MNLNTIQYGDIGIDDITLVGGKNASLGEMYNQLVSKGIKIPDGFATTSTAFWNFLDENDLRKPLQNIISELDTEKYSNLKEIGQKARQLILTGKISDSLAKDIIAAYQMLCGRSACAVAVRSSATAEDLPSASFAGQHDTYLNVKGNSKVLEAVKKCFASLYTNRAIKYRNDQGFEHSNIALSVGIQKMVRADKGCSGVGFTIDPESGFENVILLSGVWGLGENIVQGLVNPDEYYVFKPTLKLGHFPILQKKKGDKKLTMIYNPSGKGDPTVNVSTSRDKQNKFVLSDEEVITLAKWSLIIEDHYKKPMDIEWAKDGLTKELFIIQARPETVHRGRNKNIHIEYKLLEKGNILANGSAVGSKIKVGKARILKSPRHAKDITSEHIIVTETITPDWDPLLKLAGGIITDKGGRTSHAAIVARELGVPATVGCGEATSNIKDGEVITLCCAQGKTGYIYQGALAFEEKEIDFSNISVPRTEAKLILADPFIGVS